MSQINQVKDAINIVEIIGERIELKKSGTSFKANCPFHGEKTPSFFINEQIQRFKCFGCSETGDVLDFLEKYEGMTLAEGLRYLADKAGIKLEEFHQTQADQEKEKLLEILSISKEYYHYLLIKHKAGKKALEYLKNRGITNESIKLFQLGVALPNWDGLLVYLTKKKKYKLDDIEKAGLIIRATGGRYYDRFRERIMFPLKNHRGQVVGFSGRLMDKSAKEAKYINSPETLLYHKSEMLFGYSELFREIKKKNQVIVAEGEFDVISSQQAHVNNIVAIKGSALTERQVKLLSRSSETVILALDMDSAGVEATKRAIKIVEEAGLDLRVIDWSSLGKQDEKKDPDELARENPKSWRDLSGKTVSVYEFLITASLNKYDQSSPEGKRKIINEIAPILNFIAHAVEKDFYLKKLSDELNVSLGIIKKDVEKFGSRMSDVGFRKNKELRIENKDSKKVSLEKYLLFLLFRSGSKNIKQRAEKLIDFDFELAGANQVIKELLNFKPEFELDKFSKFLAEDLRQNLMDWYAESEFAKLYKKGDLKQEFDKIYHKIEQEKVRSKINLLNQEISKIEGIKIKTDEEEERLGELLGEIVELQRQLKN